MPAFPFGGVATLREAAESTMVDVAQVMRRVVASDGMGGVAATYRSAGYTKVRVDGLPDTSLRADQELAGRESNSKKWVLVFPAGTDILATDRVIVDGRTFEVDSPNAPRSIEVTIKVFAQEVL